MLHRLCGSPSIPLSFTLASVLPRRNTKNVSDGTRSIKTPDTKYSSFRARTTGVSNPVCSPGFRAISVSVGPATRLRRRCSSRYLRISPLHREFQLPLPHSSTTVSLGRSELSPEISQVTCRAAYAPFTPSKSEQRLVPTYYRGCWHVVSRTLQIVPSFILPILTKFTSRKTSSFTRRCWVRLSPIAQNSRLLPPVGV